jgi:hypothetical protein
LARATLATSALNSYAKVYLRQFLAQQIEKMPAATPDIQDTPRAMRPDILDRSSEFPFVWNVVVFFDMRDGGVKNGVPATGGSNMPNPHSAHSKSVTSGCGRKSSQTGCPTAS